MKLLSISLAGFSLLTLASCSGTETLTAEELADQANAICGESTDKLLEAVGSIGPLGEDASDEQYEAFFDAFIEVGDELVNQLDELAAPSAIEEDYAAFITLEKDAMSRAKELGPEILESGTDPFDGFNTLATKLGLDECA